MSIKFAPYKDYSIGYKVKGEGKAIFLIPGFTESLHIFENTETIFSSSYKVISIDLPGTFTSARLFDAESEWTMELLSDVILTVAHTENIENFCVLGHSLGGYIALTLASNHPEKLNGLGLIHSTAFADSKEKIEFRLKSIDFISKHGSEKFIEQIVKGLYGEEFRDLYPELVNNHLLAAQTINKEVLISQYKAMMFRPDHSDTLQKFNKPVLFLAGEEDNSVPLKDSLSQCCLPRISQISILKKTGHMGFVEQPEKSAKILRNYFQLVFGF